MEEKAANTAGPLKAAPEDEALLRPRQTGKSREGPRPLLGEMAVEAGFVLPEKLASALERQREWMKSELAARPASPPGQAALQAGFARLAEAARELAAAAALHANPPGPTP